MKIKGLCISKILLHQANISSLSSFPLFLSLPNAIAFLKSLKKLYAQKNCIQSIPEVKWPLILLILIDIVCLYVLLETFLDALHLIEMFGRNDAQ